MRHTLGGLAAALLLCASTVTATELRVLEWEGYISPFEKDFEAWAKSRGKDIDLVILSGNDGKPLYITSPDDIFESARRQSADVVTPSSPYYKQERGKLMQLLHPLDISRLANYGHLYGKLRSASYARDDAGKVYGVPLFGGPYALAYNTAKSNAPDSWAVLFEPAAKGKFSVTNDLYDANVFQMALLAGVSPGDVYDIERYTPAQQAATQENLNRLVANMGDFWDGSLMASPEQLDTLHYATDYGFGVIAANRKGRHWALAAPKEGMTLWLDNVSIVRHVAADPAKLEAAYLLIDYLIDVEAQTFYGREYGVVVNPRAKPRIDTPQPGEEFFREEFFWQPLSSRTRNSFKLMWDNALKSAGRK